MKRRARFDEDATQQLTSMIDVVFLLLVFFVCTMSFRVIEGRLDTELPKDVGHHASQEVLDLLEPLDVAVSVDPRRPRGFAVHVGGRPVALDDLSGIVAGALAAIPELSVRIDARDGVTHGHVVSVLDQCFAGGAERLQFAG